MRVAALCAALLRGLGGNATAWYRYPRLFSFELNFTYFKIGFDTAWYRYP